VSVPKFATELQAPEHCGPRFAIVWPSRCKHGAFGLVALPSGTTASEADLLNDEPASPAKPSARAVLLYTRCIKEARLRLDGTKLGVSCHDGYPHGAPNPL
jgi:hypothetical protein